MSDQDQPERNAPRQHISARVPESVSRGTFSTGVLVMTGASEFILDFVQNLGQPAQVVARVVMPHATIPQFIEALNKNLELYKSRFGEPPELPKPPANAKKPTLQEIYDDLKISDDVAHGAYANAVMIGHAASEFKFDFMANLIPQPVVSNRVYLAAPHVPRLLQSLSKTFEDLQNRMKQQQRPPETPPTTDMSSPPPNESAPPAAPESPSNEETPDEETPDENA